MNLWRNVTEPAVRGRSQANGMVVVSRQFWVPAAEAIRWVVAGPHCPSWARTGTLLIQRRIGTAQIPATCRHSRDFVSPDAGVCWLSCRPLPYFTHSNVGVAQSKQHRTRAGAGAGAVHTGDQDRRIPPSPTRAPQCQRVPSISALAACHTGRWCGATELHRSPESCTDHSHARCSYRC